MHVVNLIATHTRALILDDDDSNGGRRGQLRTPHVHVHCSCCRLRWLHMLRHTIAIARGAGIRFKIYAHAIAIAIESFVIWVDRIDIQIRHGTSAQDSPARVCCRIP
jgi:hypothetical protein